MEKSINSKQDAVKQVIEEGRVNEFLDRLSLQDIKEYINNNFNSEHPHQFNCPVCERKIGLEKKNINDVTLHFMSALLVMAKQTGNKFSSFHYEEVYQMITKVLGEEGKNSNEKTRPTGFTRLTKWGFIEPDTTKNRGHWRLTQLGMDFMYNQYNAPLTVYISAGQVIDWSDELITFKECDILSYEQRQQYRTTKYFSE